MSNEEPRRWEMPAEPGPEVTRVVNRVGEVWERGADGWGWVGVKDGAKVLTHHRSWRELLVGYGPLDEATP